MAATLPVGTHCNQLASQLKTSNLVETCQHGEMLPANLVPPFTSSSDPCIIAGVVLQDLGKPKV
jgi:hypothetical protein